MSFHISTRIVTSAGGIKPPCIEPVRLVQLQSMRIDYMSCCTQRISPCIAQGSAKQFDFQDKSDVDFGLATAASFDVWEKNIGGSSLYSATLSNGKLTQPNDNTLRATIADNESASFPAGAHHCEVWVTMEDGEDYCLAVGRLRVIDTRKKDT